MSDKHYQDENLNENEKNDGGFFEEPYLEDEYEEIPSEKKRSATQTAIKLLTVCCVLAALLLVGVLAWGIVKNVRDEKAPVSNGDVSQSVINPEILEQNEPSTTETTLPSTTVQNKKLAYITEDDVNVRLAASTDAEIIATLKKDTAVEYFSVDAEGWVKVNYNGTTAYIYKDYLTKTAPATATAGTPTGRKVIDPTHKYWYLLVLDKNRELPEGYVPQTAAVAGSDVELDYRIAKYYDAMYNAALEDGVELTPYSGYRTYERQKTNYEYLVSEYMANNDMTAEEAEAAAATEILPPGTSEHNYGLAMDICGTDEDFDETEEYAWLVENAHKYGFIERYTEEKQDITGIIPEPWHWRFVGISHATAIWEQDICLEEYLEQHNFEY